VPLTNVGCGEATHLRRSLRFPFLRGFREFLPSAHNKLSGSISTSTAVSGISLPSQYATAPLSNFVSTERFGDFSKNWNRCSFFSRASGAVAGPRMRTPRSLCGEKYSENRRDQRMAFSRLTSRTLTLASEVNGGYAINPRK